MRRVLAAFALLWCCSAFGMQKYQNWCEQGGVKVSILSLGLSTSKFQQSFPGCTVTVYDHGTSNLSVIYSDDGVTPKANPFTADGTTGQYFFYADNGSYDVQLSGTGLTTYTLGDIQLFDVFAPFPSINLNGNTLTAAAGSATITIPNVTDTLVNRNSAQSMTNKTIDNSPIGSTTPNTGTFTTFLAQTIAGLASADQFSGGTVSDKINAAFASFGSSQGTALMPSTLGAGYSSDSPLPSNLSFIDLRTGTSASPITSAISKSPNFYMTRYDNTQAYTRQGDNIVGGFNTWGSLMRLEGNSSPPTPATGSFATFISTVATSAAGNPPANYNITGSDTRLGAYIAGWRDASTDRGLTALNVLAVAEDVETHALNAIEADCNQRGSDDSTLGVCVNIASGGVKKLAAAIGISATNDTINAWQRGIQIGNYAVTGIQVNPSLNYPTAPAATLNGTVGSASVLKIGGWDFNAFKLIPVNDTDGVAGYLTKADGSTKRLAWWKRGAISFYDTTSYDGTATVNLPHGKCIGWEAFAGGSTVDGICSNSGSDRFSLNNVDVSGTITATTSVSAPQVISTVTTGTSPLSVTSTTVNSNLNADMVDGVHSGNISSGHAMCWKDSTHMGYCSTVVASDGTCTCN